MSYEISWTEHLVGRTITKVPVLAHIELITIPDSSGVGFQTRAYRYGTGIYEGHAKEENKAIIDAVEWIAGNYDIPDKVTFYEEAHMTQGEIHASARILR